MNLDTIISTFSKEYIANPKLDLKNLLDVAKSYDSSDYLQFLDYSEVSYNRVVLFRNAEFEVLLLCWMPHQASRFHNHSSNGCIMKVLEGTLTEQRKHPNNEVEMFRHQANETIYMCNDLGTHRVFNDTDATAVSLHIYSPSGFL